MRASEIGRTTPRRIVLVNPPVVVIDQAQLDVSLSPAPPYGLLQIADWLRAAGHEVQLADMARSGDRAGTWKERRTRRELHVGLSKLPTGAGGLELDHWLHARPLEWIDTWFDELSDAPDEVWITCSMVFDGFVARMVAKMVRRRFPDAFIRLGGDYATRFPEAAARSGADEVFVGRLHEADLVVPGSTLRDEGEAIRFRLTTGGPDRDGAVVEGSPPRREMPVGTAIERIVRAYELGARRFECWDPDPLHFDTHVESFLAKLAERELEIDLRFCLGFEPDRVAGRLVELCAAASVTSITVPVETADPRFVGLHGRTTTIVSSIRALEHLKEGKLDLAACRGTIVLGYPNEQLDDIFTQFHVLKEYGLASTPLPVVPVPGTAVHERYGSRLGSRRHGALNGHLFPLLSNPNRVNLYRRLVLLLRTSDRREADKVVARYPRWVDEAYDRGRERACQLIEAALASGAPDSAELLERLRPPPIESQG